ncbi:hypothetical protein GCM10025785_09090 [Corynebacterium canis]
MDHQFYRGTVVRGERDEVRGKEQDVRVAFGQPAKKLFGQGCEAVGGGRGVAKREGLGEQRFGQGGDLSKLHEPTLVT